MWGCEDVRMWGWEDVKMRRCFTDPHYWKNPALRRSREKFGEEFLRECKLESSTSSWIFHRWQFSYDLPTRKYHHQQQHNHHHLLIVLVTNPLSSSSAGWFSNFNIGFGKTRHNLIHTNQTNIIPRSNWIGLSPWFVEGLQVGQGHETFQDHIPIWGPSFLQRARGTRQ